MMSEPREELVNQIAEVPLGSSQRVAILAGHYCVSPGLEELGCDAPAESLSFAGGAALYNRVVSRGSSARIYLWVNDIGVAPDARAELKNNYRLPDHYAATLRRYSAPADAVEVLFESSTRNKASTLLREMRRLYPERFELVDPARKDLVRCVESAVCSTEVDPERRAYAVKGPSGEWLVVKEGPNPKCNLIIATLYERIRKAFQADLVVNVFNELYVHRIRLGTHVARTVFHNATATRSVFCGDDSVALLPDPSDIAQPASPPAEAAAQVALTQELSL
jgi:hypothetical protein